MANATRDRNTIKKLSAVYQPQAVLNASATTIHYYGTMQCSDGSGRAVNPGAAGASTRVIGVVKSRVDNSAGVADAKKVELETGPFIFENDASIGLDDIGKDAFAIDNQTVGIAGTITAGKIMAVHTYGVEVWIGAGGQ